MTLRRFTWCVLSVLALLFLILLEIPDLFSAAAATQIVPNSVCVVQSDIPQTGCKKLVATCDANSDNSLNSRRLVASRTNNPLTHLGSIGGNTKAIAIDGKYAYIGEGLGLTVMDISDPNQPVVVGRTPAFAILNEVVASGDYVYAAARPFGELWVIKVSDPANPIPVSSDNSYWIWSLSTDGSYLYAGTFGGNGGLHVYDIANPAAPQEVGHLNTGAFPDDMDVSGDLVFIGDLDGGLVIVDVSDPTLPVELARVEIGPGQNVQAVAVAGDYVYTEYGGLFRIFDIGDPANPVEVGSVGLFSGARVIEVAGNVTFTADGLGRVVTIDVSNPTQPQQLKVYATEDRVEDLALAGQHLYFADRASGIWVLDVTNPADPVEVGVYNVVDRMSAVVASGDYAYVTDIFEGLMIVDVSDPTLPQPVGFYNSPLEYGGDGLALDGHYVYLATGFDGLRVVDVSDPANPTEVGKFSDLSVRDVALQDGHAYLTDGSGKLSILDVGNPAAPTEIAAYDLGGQNIEVVGDRAYIVRGPNGLRVLDIADPQAVTEIGAFNTNNRYAVDVALMGDYALLAVRDHYLLVLDVSDPTNIQPIGEFSTNPSSVAVHGNRAYVGGLASFKVIDVSDPTNPTLVDSVEYLGGSVFQDVYLTGGLVYAAGIDNGMQIYTTTPIPTGDERLYLPIVLR